jgi:hypothetical protein
VCVCVCARSRTAFSFSVYKQTCKRGHDNGYPRFKHMHRYVIRCRMHECACMNMDVLSFKCALLRGSVRALERVRVHACMRVFFFECGCVCVRECGFNCGTTAMHEMCVCVYTRKM